MMCADLGVGPKENHRLYCDPSRSQVVALSTTVNNTFFTLSLGYLVWPTPETTSVLWNQDIFENYKGMGRTCTVFTTRGSILSPQVWFQRVVLVAPHRIFFFPRRGGVKDSGAFILEAKETCSSMSVALLCFTYLRFPELWNPNNRNQMTEEKKKL